MSDISKIKLPNNVTYDLKDNGAVRVDDLKSKGSSCQPVYFDNDGNALPISSGVILATKNYNGFVASGNADPSGWYYFANIKPINNYDIWHVKYKVYMEVPMNSTNASTYMHYKYDGIVEFYGRQQDVTAYYIFNNVANGSYRPFYNHIMYRALTAKASTAGHVVGFRFQSAANPNNASYARNIKIELLEYNKCEFTFFDSMLLYSEIPNTGSTNYGVRTEYNGTSNGLQETGDNDTYGHNAMHNKFLKNNPDFRLCIYPIFGMNTNSETMGLSLYQSEYTGGTNGISTTRVYNQGGFDITKGLYYHWTYVNTAKSGDLNQHVFYDYSAIDLRYSDNAWYSYNPCNFAMLRGKPVYLRGVIKEDGLFYLRPFDATQIIVDGYYINSTKFATTDGGSTNISTYTSLNSNVTYRDIKTGTYYAYNSTAKKYSVTTDYSSKPAYQKVWTQNIPTSVEKDSDGYQYVYWFMGYPYYNGSYMNGGYQLDLDYNNKLYWYNDGAVEEYISKAISANKLLEPISARNLFIGTLNPIASPPLSRPRLIGQTISTAITGATAIKAEHGIKAVANSDNNFYISIGRVSSPVGMLGLIAGKTYTITADVSAIICSEDTSTTAIRYLQFRLYYNTDETSSTYIHYDKALCDIIEYTPSEKGEDKSAKLIHTFTIPTDAKNICIRFQPSGTNNGYFRTDYDYIKLSNLMMVEGETPVLWSAAPEDYDMLIFDGWKDIKSFAGDYSTDFTSLYAKYIGTKDSKYEYEIEANAVTELVNDHPYCTARTGLSGTVCDVHCELHKTSSLATGGTQIFMPSASDNMAYRYGGTGDIYFNCSWLSASGSSSSWNTFIKFKLISDNKL